MTNNEIRHLPLLALDGPPAAFHNFLAVWATMLAPDDPEMRKAIEARGMVKHLARRANGRTAKHFMVESTLFTTLADDRAMTRLFSGYTTAAEQKGCIVGSVLVFLYLMSLDPTAGSSLNKALHVAAQRGKELRKWGDGSRVAQTPRQLRAFWDECLAVSHLWAAQMMLHHRYKAKDGSYVLRAIHVHELLEWAEAFRRWIEGFVPHRAKKPLVGKNKLWRVPASYKLRPLALPISQQSIPDELHKWVATYKAPTMVSWD